MVTLTVNGQKVRAAEETTVLEVAREMGLSIPTLCYHEALSVYGGCRLCQVEVSQGTGFRLVAACTHPVQEGLVVRTHTEKVLKARRLILELLWSRCPDSVYLRELARQMGLERTRFRPKDESCILCGLCIRLCREKICSNTMDFVHRGPQRKVSPPFDLSSKWCLDCQCCAGICPIQAIHYTEENDLRGTLLHWNTRIDREQKVMEPPKATVVREDCSGCENCSYICPVGVIQVPEDDGEPILT